MYAKAFGEDSSENSSATTNKQTQRLQWRFECYRVFKPGHKGPWFATTQAQFWQARRSINRERLRENSPSSFSKSNNKKLYWLFGYTPSESILTEQ